MRNISEVVVHCTATQPDWRSGDSSREKVDEVRRWHVEGNGWSDIGYHYLIDRDGTVIEGRPLERAGAHVRGRNANTIGVALFGGHGGSGNDIFGDHFTPEQDAGLRGLIDTLSKDLGKLKVSGHNEYAAKACPCFKVSPWYKNKPARTSPAKSTTLQAVAATGVTGAGGVFTALGKLDPTSQIIVLVFSAVALIGLGWIARERLRKWAAGVR